MAALALGCAFGAIAKVDSPPEFRQKPVFQRGVIDPLKTPDKVGRGQGGSIGRGPRAGAVALELERAFQALQDAEQPEGLGLTQKSTVLGFRGEGFQEVQDAIDAVQGIVRVPADERINHGQHPLLTR